MRVFDSGGIMVDMTENNEKQTGTGKIDRADGVDEFLDSLIRESLQEDRIESYYMKKAEELSTIDDDCFKQVARRFQRSKSTEQEIILRLLMFFKGYDHIEFLQNYAEHESFMPRTGMIMLELFNKSDAMLRDGVASRLLELDTLVQQIKQICAGTVSDKAAVHAFLEKTKNDRVGILNQIIEECARDTAAFVAMIYECNNDEGESVLKQIAQRQTEDSFNIIADVYKKTKDKAVAKLLKKIAHALKQKGIHVDVPIVKQEKKAVFKNADLPESRTYISRVDAEGFRLVFMIKPVTTHEDKIFNLMIHLERGMNSIEVINSIRKDTRNFIKKLQSDKKTEFLEVDEATGAFLVDEACRIARDHGTIISANIDQWNKIFSDAVGKKKQPPVYDICSDFDTDDLSENDVIDRLLEAPDVKYWYVVSEEARTTLEKLRKLYVESDTHDYQHIQEKVQPLIDEAVQSFFTPQRIRGFRRRLEENAFFNYAGGDKEQVRVLMNGARLLSRKNVNPEDITFFRKLIEGSFRLFHDAYTAQEQQKQAAQNDV